MHSLEFALRFTLMYPFIYVVDPPTALPVAGVVRLEDYLIWTDACCLVCIKHPASVCKALRGVSEDELLIRGFIGRVREDVETKGDEAREEAREVLHLARGAAVIDVGDIQEVPGLRDIRNVLDETSKGLKICCGTLSCPVVQHRLHKKFRVHMSKSLLSVFPVRK